VIGGSTRIWSRDTALTASYPGSRRFLQRLGHSEPIPFRRLEVLSDEQAQVDFGTWALILPADVKHWLPHVFRMALSFSRKAYNEVGRPSEQLRHGQ